MVESRSRRYRIVQIGSVRVWRVRGIGPDRQMLEM